MPLTEKDIQNYVNDHKVFTRKGNDILSEKMKELWKDIYMPSTEKDIDKHHTHHKVFKLDGDYVYIPKKLKSYCSENAPRITTKERFELHAGDLIKGHPGDLIFDTDLDKACIRICGDEWYVFDNEEGEENVKRSVLLLG